MIKEALMKLDHQNDDHWTANGHPKVSVVRELAGDQNITAKQIKEADPNFVRIAINDEPEEEVEPISDEDLLAMEPKPVMELSREDQQRYIDLAQAVVTECTETMKRAEDELLRHMQKLTPVKDKLAYMTPEQKAEVETHNMFNYLNALKEQRENKNRFIKELNLPKRLEKQALFDEGDESTEVGSCIEVIRGGNGYCRNFNRCVFETQPAFAD